MEAKIKNLIKETKEIPSHYIKDYIWSSIEIKIKRSNRISALIFSFVSIASVSSLIFVSVRAYQDFIASGITNYFSLLLSDFATTGMLWKEFSYAILESIPVMSVMSFLGIIFITMISLKKSGAIFKQMNYSLR